MIPVRMATETSSTANQYRKLGSVETPAGDRTIMYEYGGSRVIATHLKEIGRLVIVSDVLAEFPVPTSPNEHFRADIEFLDSFLKQELGIWISPSPILLKLPGRDQLYFTPISENTSIKILDVYGEVMEEFVSPSDTC